MDNTKLQAIKARLLKGVNDPNLAHFINTSFKTMEKHPTVVVESCAELITDDVVQDKSSAFVVGSLAGISLCLALDQGDQING